MSTSLGKKSNHIAIAYTALFLCLLLTLFIFVVFTIPSKPTQGLDLYIEDGASGSIAASNTSIQSYAGSEPVQNGTKYITDNTVNTVITPGTSEAENEVKGEQQTTVDPELQQLLDKVNIKQGTGIKGTGKLAGTDNHTDPGFEKNSSTEVGKPFLLSGRALLKKPEAPKNITEQGTVVVEIIVDSKGKVISAIPGQKGTNTTSSRLYAIAAQKAREAEFNPTSQNTEQRGTYTFVFLLE
ncbi:MAG: hypothetical protein WAQ28_10245 [Bacteroidia bacterium]